MPINEFYGFPFLTFLLARFFNFQDEKWTFFHLMSFFILSMWTYQDCVIFLSFFFLLEFLKYISQHCTIQDLTSDNATKTYIYCLLYCFSKKETFDVFWYGGMPSWQKLGTFLQNWSYQKMSRVKFVLLTCSML